MVVVVVVVVIKVGVASIVEKVSDISVVVLIGIKGREISLAVVVVVFLVVVFFVVVVLGVFLGKGLVFFVVVVVEGVEMAISVVDLIGEVKFVCVEKGFDGGDGVDGLDCVDGVDGVDGLDGLDGVDGVDGVDGKDVDGVDGLDGVDVVDGVDGRDGKDGVNGLDGVNGFDGVDAKVELIGYGVVVNVTLQMTSAYNIIKKEKKILKLTNTLTNLITKLGLKFSKRHRMTQILITKLSLSPSNRIEGTSHAVLPVLRVYSQMYARENNQHNCNKIVRIALQSCSELCNF